MYFPPVVAQEGGGELPWDPPHHHHHHFPGGICDDYNTIFSYTKTTINYSSKKKKKKKKYRFKTAAKFLFVSFQFRRKFLKNNFLRGIFQWNLVIIGDYEYINIAVNKLEFLIPVEI